MNLRLRTAGVAFALLVLVDHVYTYWFLTDDAFISFRYARNLHDGYGLVFNPGFERVEGYTNFLWVVLLTGVHALTGLAPDRTANWLSCGAGVALWGLTVAFCWRRSTARPWLVLFPAWWLALNRSFAVWCTGGLETKLFELLVVAAVLWSVRDVEEGRTGWAGPAVLLALGALTRPDGILFAAVLLAARGTYELSLSAKRGMALRDGPEKTGPPQGERKYSLNLVTEPFALRSRRRFGGVSKGSRTGASDPQPWQDRLNWRAAATAIGLFVLIVGGHFVFRRVYYAEWLPNTYYAKLGGESWWDMGALYFRTFLLEYGALVWLPLLLVGSVARVSAGRGAAVWLIAAVIVPHAIYIAYCGGDHFEYRPLDVYFPLLAVLLFDAAVCVAEQWRRPALAALWGAACCLAITAMSILAHTDFPADYRAGFPGIEGRDDSTRDLVDLRRHQELAAVPGVTRYIEWYNRGVQTLSEHFIALRQEEHRLFLTTVEPEGKILARMVAAGLLPRDTFIAVPCVGAIPYFSDLRTLDVLGLTDKHVARQKMEPKAERKMAHAKEATFDYMDARKVDVIAPEVHLVTNDPEVLDEWRDYARQMGTFVPVYFSKPFFGGYIFFGIIRKPPEVARARFPALGLSPGWE